MENNGGVSKQGVLVFARIDIFRQSASFLRDYREFLRDYREYFEKAKRDKERVKNFQGYLDFKQNIRKGSDHFAHSWGDLGRFLGSQ